MIHNFLPNCKGFGKINGINLLIFWIFLHPLHKITKLYSLLLYLVPIELYMKIQYNVGVVSPMNKYRK